MGPEKPSLNLEDIAKFAGVSRSTVSRVINNAPNVSETTRARVLEVIEEHNFTPNVAARSLVTQRSQVLGIYIPHLVDELFADPYFSILIQSITTRANEQDYDVMLWLTGQQSISEHLHRRALDNRLVDGLVLASTSKYDPFPPTLLERGRTFICNGRPFENDQAYNYVDTTNQRGAQQAVEHLARLGRKRIATVTGRMDLTSGYDRLQGYRHGMEQLGLPCDDSLIAESDFTEIGGYMGMRRLLPYKPEAVFVASDLMALGALRAIR
ncbi:MAG: LacI family transcriptional regulator, partial [Chloroflexi bacterium]|nr:LacI family transcriptional regulator [Chloroflexota bacterium]